MCKWIMPIKTSWWKPSYCWVEPENEVSQMLWPSEAPRLCHHHHHHQSTVREHLQDGWRSSAKQRVELKVHDVTLFVLLLCGNNNSAAVIYKEIKRLRGRGREGEQGRWRTSGSCSRLVEKVDVWEAQCQRQSACLLCVCVVHPIISQ